MPRKYPQDYKLRAVALAEIRSLPVASRELGLPIETLTRWVEEEPPTPALERAVNLALSELTARIADGTIKGRDLTVAYGVLRDKWARYGRAETVQEPHAFGDDWLDALEAHLPALGYERCYALVALIHRGDWLADDGLLHHSQTSREDHDAEELAWEAQYQELSTKDRATVVEAIVEDQVAYLATLGPFQEWLSRDRAEHTRQYEAQIAKNEAMAAAYMADYHSRIHPEPIPDAIPDRLNGQPVDDLREGRSDGGADERSLWRRLGVWVVEQW